MNRATFTQSKASGAAGGVAYVSSDSPLAADTSIARFTDCVVNATSASYYGSVIYNRLSKVIVSNILVEDAAKLTSNKLGTFFNSGGSYDCTSACDTGEYGEVSCRRPPPELSTTPSLSSPLSHLNLSARPSTSVTRAPVHASGAIVALFIMTLARYRPRSARCVRRVSRVLGYGYVRFVQYII